MKKNFRIEQLRANQPRDIIINQTSGKKNQI